MLQCKIMEISWLGHSCFRIRGKQACVVTDPVSPGKGYSLGKLSANIVTVSHNHNGHNYTARFSDNPHVLYRPGEYEVSSVLIIGLTSFHDTSRGSERGKNTIFVFETEEMSICHLGDLGYSLTASQIEEIGKVDILMIPVGGGSTINATAASSIVRQIDPKIVLPMHYKTSLFQDTLDPIEVFLKEMGVSDTSTKPKLSINKNGLPLATQVTLLELQPVK